MRGQPWPERRQEYLREKQNQDWPPMESGPSPYAQTPEGRSVVNGFVNSLQGLLPQPTARERLLSRPKADDSEEPTIPADDSVYADA